MPTSKRPQDSDGRRSANRLDDNTTSWNEFATAGVELQEAASTTLPPYSRFTFIRDGEVLAVEDVRSLVTHEKPLYRITADPGETWIVRGDRNAYTAGFDSVSGIAAQLGIAGVDGYAPPGVTFDQAYGVLREGEEDGFTSQIRDDDAICGIYNDGELVKTASAEDNEWDVNPFTDPRYDYDATTFVVKRADFGLYGADDVTWQWKLRKIDPESGDVLKAELLDIATLGIHRDPSLRVYNLPNSVRVMNDGEDPIDFSVGPIQFYNRFSGEIPNRPDRLRHRDIEVTADIEDDEEYTVVAVYRLDEDQIESGTQIEQLSVDSGAGIDIQIREVLPRHIDMPAEFDWVAAGGKKLIGETSLLEADINPGDATIQTFVDDDDVRKPRGFARGEAFSAGGDSPGPGEDRDADEAESSAFLNEYYWFVLLAEAVDPPQTADNIVIGKRERR